MKLDRDYISYIDTGESGNDHKTTKYRKLFCGAYHAGPDQPILNALTSSHSKLNKPIKERPSFVRPVQSE